MKQATGKILTVPTNGQISIGKEWAGKQIKVQMIDQDHIAIEAVYILPASHATFYTAEAKKQLQEFDAWAEKSKPKQTDLKSLREQLEKKRR